MARTYLSMAQAVASDAGYAGNIQSVAAVTGDAARIVRFVSEACEYVEALWGDWRFLWGGLYEGITLANVKTIAPPVGLYRWDQARMFIGDFHCSPIPYHEFHPYRGIDRAGYVETVVIMPDNSLNMYPHPDKDMNFTLSWYKSPMVLVNDEDEPNMPDKFRKIIESYALWLYAMYDDSQELAAKAQGEYEKWLRLLEADQRPGGYPTNQSYGNHVVISAE